MYAKTITAASLFVASLSVAGMASAQNLTVILSGLTSEQGQLVVRVYNSEKHWLSDKTDEIFQQQSFALQGQVKDATIQFSLELPAGDYALSLFQDKDNNGELKSNWIGIPKEPVATSNNAKGSMGPPDYKDAVFQIADQPAVQQLNLASID
ncbi:DUF2141 domain-containing protein [Rheinheimera sp. 1928-s]|uniref:DUF2141 domain-containing protein n=1 Tax=Rheinheimera sp. 1928-s TaxID=3033803 RepID=UPI00261A4DD8|nr:DUF2141 domain-containing protein [Rheinheimera sp. 1928-s]MDF3125322.1 DUF2141 domain-containing protein [Rheinheimera sp. 1928-s]